MRQGVQQRVSEWPAAGEFDTPRLVPRLFGFVMPVFCRLHLRPRLPVSDTFVVDLDQDPFSAEVHGGKPTAFGAADGRQPGPYRLQPPPAPPIHDTAASRAHPPPPTSPP